MAPMVAPLQGHFDGGEVSPLLYGRVDSERYKSSLALCKNWIPTLQGGLTRRVGTNYVATVKTSANKTRLIPFEFSTTQAYMLEFGAGYIRFYANYGQVLKSGVPYEITTPYQQADLFQLKFTQSADVLYIVHPKYPPMKLERYSSTNWQLVTIPFLDGPYQSINTTQITFTPSAASGNGVTLTIGPTQTITGCANNGSGLIRVTVGNHGWATGQTLTISGVVGTTEANDTWIITTVDRDHFDLTTSGTTGNPSAFVHAYVSGGSLYPVGLANPFRNIITPAAIGAPIRLEHGTKWGWAIITAASGNTLTVDVQTAFNGTTATTSWAMGLWQGYAFGVGLNYPSTVCFHEDRLAFTGTPSNPQRVDLSNTGDYENFAPTALDGTVLASNALSFSLNANDVNLNEWLNSDEKGLLAGSVSAEWVIRPSSIAEAMSPTNISAKRSSKWGSANIQTVQVGKATIYVQRGARKLREFMFYFDIDGYRSTDLTELAEHITGSGVIDMAYQSLPISVVWLVRNDGALLGMTYDRDMSQLRVGWHWHVLGGTSDAAGSPPIVESIAVIPSPDGLRDDLWMIVQRYINGQLVRTVEYMEKIFEGIDQLRDAFFVDCGATYDVPITVTGISNANPAVVTAPAHGFSTGNTVRIYDVKGMYQTTGSTTSLVNDTVFTVTVIDANTFSLNGLNTSAGTAYVSGGVVRKLVTTISGLTYLANETVSVFGDGADLGDLVVSNTGSITLPTAAAVVQIGYSYNSDGQLLRLEAGSRNGTSLGKNRRIHRVGLMVNRALSLQVGPGFTALDNLNIDLSQGPFSGIVSQEVGFDYDFQNQISFRVSRPVPCTLLAIMPMMETQDRA